MPDIDPNASDGDAAPDGATPWKAVDLSRPGWGDDAYVGGSVQLGGLDGLSSNLGQQLGRAMLAVSLRQDPGSVDPGARRFLNTMALPLTAPSYPTVGLLGSLDHLKAGSAPPADTLSAGFIRMAQAYSQGKNIDQESGEPPDQQSTDQDGPDLADIQEAAAVPATRFATSGQAPPDPKTLDPIVERHVAGYNRARGLKPGDAEYLDADLVRAIIRQEAGWKADALARDPM